MADSDKSQSIDSNAHTEIESVEGWSLFVTGLHDEVSEEAVKDKFADYGPISELHMPLARETGYVRGYAIIKYRKKKSAEDAISALDGTDWMDKKLQVGWAFLSSSYKST